MPWYTITDDFDADFGVDEWHGTNAFLRDDDGAIFRTYFVDKPRRRGAGQHLEPPRHHRARPPGAVGGLARGLPADPGLRLVEPATTSTTRPRGSSTPCRTPPPRSAGRTARDRQHDDAAHRAHVPGARRARVRRLDERGGDAPLVAGRGRLGDVGGRGRPARRRRGARRHARPGLGRRPRRRRHVHGDRAADPPGVHLDLGRRHAAHADRDRLLRGVRRRHHRALHPQRAVGRGGRALARGRVGPDPRQPRDASWRAERRRAGASGAGAVPRGAGGGRGGRIRRATARSPPTTTGCSCRPAAARTRMRSAALLRGLQSCERKAGGGTAG